MVKRLVAISDSALVADSAEVDPPLDRLCQQVQVRKQSERLHLLGNTACFFQALSWWQGRLSSGICKPAHDVLGIVEEFFHGLDRRVGISLAE